MRTLIYADLYALTAYCSDVTLVTLAWQDLRRRRLANLLVAAVAALYFMSALFRPEGFSTHLVLGVGMLLIGMLLTACRVMGGGDAKLFAAITCWAGPSHLWLTLLVTSQAGLALALLGLASRWYLRRESSRWARPALRCMTADRGVPYGVALALGGICAIAAQIH
jgi:prepilin peptidase CpaA